jgi:hypothetical protein
MVPASLRVLLPPMAGSADGGSEAAAAQAGHCPLRSATKGRNQGLSGKSRLPRILGGGGGESPRRPCAPTRVPTCNWRRRTSCANRPT